MTDRDWLEWHRPYDEPGSPLQRRLRIVQALVEEALDRLPDDDGRLISMCAGQGRDVIDVLASYPHGSQIRARLVELDPRNVEIAREAAKAAQLDRVEVLLRDAGDADAYEGALPADIVLACGVFGNISDDDIAFTIEQLPRLCAAGATVVWTRHRNHPDLTPKVGSWFERAGFSELAFVTPDGTPFGIGAHRLTALPEDPPAPGTRFFTFVGFDTLNT